MMNYIDESFLLNNDTARELYLKYAAPMPIYDYHCHLPPAQIAGDTQFDNIFKVWLAGDHYKWRVMRANGVSEEFVTGGASDKEKFFKWAQTVPHTIGNPLYQWTHLELKRIFGIDGLLLGPDTAEEVWQRTNELLSDPEFSARGIIKRMNVKVICTTDDPADSLEYHDSIASEVELPFQVYPAFRPDKAYNVDDPASFTAYLEKLKAASGESITDFTSLLNALRKQLEFFHSKGARLSDHALVLPAGREYTFAKANSIFQKVTGGEQPSPEESEVFKTACLAELGKMYAEKGWVMQLHLGALRNVNTKMYNKIGPDTGFDTMADGTVAEPLSRFLNILERENKLPKTIIYTLNPVYNEVIATAAGCFQNGSVPGKMQFGSGWWFNDQKDGMERQMTALANTGLLSRFVGMLTDSRSFISYPRHEMFRRILCNLLGTWAESGDYPKDMDLLGPMVQNICYNNAVNYFKLGE
jgi:glucuronate isomerase